MATTQNLAPSSNIISIIPDLSCQMNDRHLCPNCATFLKERPSTEETSTCVVCLGVWDTRFVTRLAASVQSAVRPYVAVSGSNKNNHFSRKATTPTVILPGDIIRRYEAVCRGINQQTPKKSPQDLTHILKEFTKSSLLQCLDEIEKEWHKKEDSTDGDDDILPDVMTKSDEELGHLAVHVIVTPKRDIPRPPQANHHHGGKKHNRRKRRHFDGKTQGGDPRNNLEQRLLQEKGMELWTLNQALEKTGPPWNDKSCEQLLQSLRGEAYDIHVAVWRRPFYVRSEYTKVRRDVSQTPFFVEDDGKRRRLGISSVEEEILPALVKACGGISTQNTDPTNKATVFGMAKFHGSGREDMDVRCILPDKVPAGKNITGRPFVCEVTDAHHLPSMRELECVVQEINHLNPGEEALGEGKQSYGKNPNGVGIAPGLQYVPSSSFKNLQADTEDKVKHYGCLCWSKGRLPDTDEELRKKLGDFPVGLEQRTPIRVLHRRSNLIRNRQVLSCEVKRIDEHYFRLFISTEAGTYVKEFVHGDLGRTKPSIGSILNCKADILELDCCGIEIGT
eukprot:scaffold7349_cov173-Amphora_coffeaeformis.AAC.13